MVALKPWTLFFGAFNLSIFVFNFVSNFQSVFNFQNFFYCFLLSQAYRLYIGTSDGNRSLTMVDGWPTPVMIISICQPPITIISITLPHTAHIFAYVDIILTQDWWIRFYIDQILGFCQTEFCLNQKISWKSLHSDILNHLPFLFLRETIKKTVEIFWTLAGKKFQPQFLSQNFKSNSTKNSNYPWFFNYFWYRILGTGQNKLMYLEFWIKKLLPKFHWIKKVQKQFNS